MTLKKLIVTFLMIGILTACAALRTEHSTAEPVSKAEMHSSQIAKAIAVLHPTKGNEVEGTVTFTKVDKGIRIVADIKNLKPGSHGFHVHEYGDCSAEDGTSAGGHFNPHNMSHGGPDADQRHVGDLGNIVADESGQAKLDIIDSHLSFEGPASIIGRAVIVHAQADDLKTQPTGAAGGRVACGVIGIAK